MMRKDQKDLLAPFADAVSEMYATIEAASDVELMALVRASEAASETNCDWATYRAAEIVGSAAGDELRVRSRRADAVAALTPSPASR